jgi:SdrD B-like domain
MSREVHHAELREETQQLLHGPLKNVRAAALAAALVPLASVAATPAAAQQLCQSAGTVCGFVWDDTNSNGVQDAGEPGREGVKVFLYDGVETVETETGPDGFYYFNVGEGTYTIFAQVPTGTEPSPQNQGGDPTKDSDGQLDGYGNSVATNVQVVGLDNPDTDFGFTTAQVSNPGTGTPGYWKNHPEAWPVPTVTVGGVTYTVDQAIAILKKVGKDKTTTMFSSLVPAMLNVAIGNDPSCVSDAIAAAQGWLTTYALGSGVAGSSAAWAVGEPTHQHLDAYNNGRLCAPHRQ